MSYFPHANTVDSRDLVDCLERLGVNDYEALPGSFATDSDEILEENAFDPNDRDEILALVGILEELDQEASESPRDGIQMIADSYFEEYAQDLAEDIGAMDPKQGWPHTCIDWAKAAQELQQDYATVTIDGQDYWVR